MYKNIILSILVTLLISCTNKIDRVNPIPKEITIENNLIYNNEINNLMSFSKKHSQLFYFSKVEVFTDRNLYSESDLPVTSGKVSKALDEFFLFNFLKDIPIDYTNKISIRSTYGLSYNVISTITLTNYDIEKSIFTYKVNNISDGFSETKEKSLELKDYINLSSYNDFEINSKGDKNGSEEVITVEIKNKKDINENATVKLTFKNGILYESEITKEEVINLFGNGNNEKGSKITTIISSKFINKID